MRRLASFLNAIRCKHTDGTNRFYEMQVNILTRTIENHHQPIFENVNGIPQLNGAGISIFDSRIVHFERLKEFEDMVVVPGR